MSNFVACVSSFYPFQGSSKVGQGLFLAFNVRKKVLHRLKNLKRLKIQSAREKSKPLTVICLNFPNEPCGFEQKD